MRIATWNVNSLRSRIDRVEAFLQRHDIDVLALQETKAREDQLPLMGLTVLGYDIAAVGHDQWNGVAIISRVGIEDVEVGFPGMPTWGDPAAAEARAIGATCGGVRVWSLYVPNGRKVDDPHYVYKLEWLARLREAARSMTGDVALVGDWNIAPQDDDVFDIAAVRRRAPTSPRASGLRSTAFSTTGTSTSPDRTRRARRSTPTGTTTGSATSATAACASTSCWATPPSPRGSPAPSSTATSGPAREPATTPR